ncbi:MAG: heavy-metal-associated domain-containing protein [Crenarchaeota archaeon]|nr:heavy-metal-associated domain-containing protein [Thermoproteota archaeon]
MSHKKLKNSSQHQRNKLCKLRTSHRKSIGKLNGVTHANVNLAEKVLIDYNPALLTKSN